MEGLVVLAVGLYVAAITVTFQKGKTGFGWIGIVGLLPPLAPFLAWFPLIGALRLAKPGSSWARSRYSPPVMQAAQQRFPGVAPAPAPVPARGGLPPPPPAGTVASLAPPAPNPATGDSVPDEEVRANRRQIIGEFLERAQREGIIDAYLHEDLRLLLDRDEGPSTVSPSVEATETRDPPREDYPTGTGDDRKGLAPSPPRAAASPPTPARPPATRPTPPASHPEVRPPAQKPPSPATPTPAAPTVPQARPIRRPRQPSPIVAKASEVWSAVRSDIALYGFAYLGVLLTLVGVLGFLLFAYEDVQIEAQPFVQLFIALVFFGWGWVLKRQDAVRVSTAMNFIGQVLLPLILFAGYADDAPFPPSFEGSALIIVMTITAFALSAGYAWMSAKRPDSTVRYLVAPLVWLGAMAAGFAFKDDEEIVGDAITRLVSPQPAMAAAAIALTLLAAHRWRRRPFARPAVIAAAVGVPLSYLLTVSLAVAEGWERSVPLVILGLSTVVSVELLGRWFGRMRELSPARPLLLAGAVAPLVPTWGIGWSGLAITVAYLAIGEWSQADDDPNPVGLALAGVGAAVGAAMSLAEPGAALPAFTLLTAWAHLRRLRPGGLDRFELGSALTVAAAVLPVGIGYSLHGLLDAPVAWIALASIAAVASLTAVLLRSRDRFWAAWPAAAGWVVAAGSLAMWLEGGRVEKRDAIAIGIAAVGAGIGSRWGAARVWMGTALGAAAVAVALETERADPGDRVVVWASIGLTLVLAAAVWRRRPVGHLAAAGHLISAGALAALPGGTAETFAVTAFALGWLASVIAGEGRGESLTTLLGRAATGEAEAEGSSRSARFAGWLAPTALVTSLPFAVLTLAKHWDEFAAHRSWTGVALAIVALLYGVGVRLFHDHRPLSRVLAVGATITSIIGLAVAAPESIPIIFTGASLIAVAILITGDLRSPGFIWLAWIVSVLLAMQVGRQFGIATADVYAVSLAYGAFMLIGGLVFDDVRAGRRTAGQGLRVGWLRHPVLVGAAAVPLSLGPIFSLGEATFGWWSLGAAAAYFAVALLLRVGGVTAPAYALAVVGLAALSPWSLVDHPWRLVFLAAPMIALAWLVGRRTDGRRDLWLGWEGAPLVVAHLVAGFALVMSLSNGTEAATTGAFGALSIAVGLLYRHRAWADIGNALVLISAAISGTGWLALALVATSLRGMVATRITIGAERFSYQLMASVAAGASWVALGFRHQWSATTAVSVTAVVFGILAVGIALLTRFKALAPDTATVWGGLATVGVASVAINMFDVETPPIEGPWLAVGIALLALGFEIAPTAISRWLKPISPAIAGVGWAALAIGEAWNRSEFAGITALVFGGAAAAVGTAVRLTPLGRRATIRWGLLTVVGVAAGAVASIDADPLWAPGVALGLAAAALGLELAAAAIDPALRLFSVAAVGSAWVALSGGFGWDRAEFVLITALVYGAASLLLGVLSRWGGISAPSVRRWGVLAIIGLGVAATVSLEPGLEPFWGPEVALGLTLLAVGAELAAPRAGDGLRYLSVLAIGVAWPSLAHGLGWEPAQLVLATSLVFGGAAAILGVLARLLQLSRPTILRWGALAAVGVIAAAVGSLDRAIDPTWGPGVAAGLALLALGMEMAAPTIERGLRYGSVVATGAAWLALVDGMAWGRQDAVAASTLAFGLLTLFVAEAARMRRPDRPPKGEVTAPLHIWRAWLALGVAGTVISAAGGAATDDPDLMLWAAAAAAACAVAASRAAAPVFAPWLRDFGAVAALAAVTLLGRGLALADAAVGAVVVVVSVAATFVSLASWNRRLTTQWLRPLIVLATLANVEAALFAVQALPSRGLFVAVMFSVGVQTLAMGLSLDRPGLLGVGPPILGAAFLFMIAENVTGSTQWYTVPVGLVVLSEVEILRKVIRDREWEPTGIEVPALEWVGIGILGAPPLVEMFVRGIGFGLLAFAAAAFTLVWAVATRVRRRAIAAASLAVATAVLMIFAAAAGGAPDSAFFWIVAVGIGFAVMLVAALIEAYRSKKGRVMARVDDLMEDWE